MWFKKNKRARREEILRSCNFRLAARQMAIIFEISSSMDKSQGGYSVYKKEFVDGWENFAANPSFELAKQFLDNVPECEAFILEFFAGCCPGGKFYRGGTRTAAEFILGDYRLDMRLQDIKDLRELTKQEYAVFGRDSLQEVVYHADPTEFVGRTWNMMVGTIEGKIYQLGASLAFSADNAEKETRELIRNVYEYCEPLLGVPTEETQGYFIWDTDTGKVIFQYAVLKETDTFAANLFVGDRGDQRYSRS